MYHAIAEPLTPLEAPYCTPPAVFANQMQWLSENGIPVISLSRLVQVIQGAPLSRPSVVITFDDGYDCVLRHAAPVLARHGYPSTVFAIASLLGAQNTWDMEIGMSRRTLMTASQLRLAAASGISVGSHTSHHVKLNSVNTSTVRAQLRESRIGLENILGLPVLDFAYPYGQFDRIVRAEVIDAGYRSACSVIPGQTAANSDSFVIRRANISGLLQPHQFASYVTSGTLTLSERIRSALRHHYWRRKLLAVHVEA